MIEFTDVPGVVTLTEASAAEFGESVQGYLVQQFAEALRQSKGNPLAALKRMEPVIIETVRPRPRPRLRRFCTCDCVHCPDNPGNR